MRACVRACVRSCVRACVRVRVCLSKHVCITHMHKLRMHAHAHAHAHAPRAPPSSTPLTVPPLFTLPPLSLAGDPGTIMNSFSCTGTNEKTTCSQCVRARARAYVCVCVRACVCPSLGHVYVFTCLRCSLHVLVCAYTERGCVIRQQRQRAGAHGLRQGDCARGTPASGGQKNRAPCARSGAPRAYHR